MNKLKLFLSKLWKLKPNYDSHEMMPDALLLFFFTTSAFPAFYWGFVFKELFNPFREAVNATGFNTMSIAASFLMLFLAFQVWFFGCIARRTGEILYSRWFC